MPTCQNCNSEVPVGNNYCPQCGSPMQAAAAPPIPPPVPPAGTAAPAPPAASPAGMDAPSPSAPPPGMVAPPQPPPVAPPGAPAGGIPVAPPFVAAKRKGLSRGAKIALACAVFLIIVLVVVGVIFFVGAIAAPTKVANNYVKALNSGDLATAWNYLSSSTQKVNTRSGFDSKMRKLKNDISKWDTSNFKVQTGGRTTIVMDLTYADGTKVTWDMYFVKENGEWKIARVVPRT